MKRRSFLKLVGASIAAPAVMAKAKPDVLTTDMIREVRRKALLAESRIKPDKNGMINICDICIQKNRCQHKIGLSDCQINAQKRLCAFSREVVDDSLIEALSGLHS